MVMWYNFNEDDSLQLFVIIWTIVVRMCAVWNEGDEEKERNSNASFLLVYVQTQFHLYVSHMRMFVYNTLT